MNWLGDITSIAQSLGLKKKGSEYKGPCPECGGNDRFHIQKGRTHPIVMHCRHGCDFSTLAKQMRDRGLVAKDDYDRDEYLKRKQEEAIALKRWTLRVYEENIKAGHQMSYKDKIEYRNLKNFISGVDSNQNSF
jgi:hypothetical protein